MVLVHGSGPHDRDETIGPNRPFRDLAEGLAGTGKTTAAVERMMAMLRGGVPGSELLVLLPQRTLAPAYEKALRARGAPPGSEVPSSQSAASGSA